MSRNNPGLCTALRATIRMVPSSILDYSSAAQHSISAYRFDTRQRYHRFWQRRQPRNRRKTGNRWHSWNRRVWHRRHDRSWRNNGNCRFARNHTKRWLRKNCYSQKRPCEHRRRQRHRRDPRVHSCVANQLRSEPCLQAQFRLASVDGFGADDSERRILWAPERGQQRGDLRCGRGPQLHTKWPKWLRLGKLERRRYHFLSRHAGPIPQRALHR